MSRFLFVLEQTLGHAAHARNIERALLEEPGIEAVVIPIHYSELRLGGLRLDNWSLRASLAARRAIQSAVREVRADAIFIHTQVAALLASDLMATAPTIVSMDATPANFDSVGAPYGHSRSIGVVEIAKLAINRRNFLAARALVTWSRWARNSLVRDYGVPAGKVHVIRPGVDTRLFRPGKPHVVGMPLRLLFVGDDFERKGGLDLLAAMRSLTGMAELDIVSNGDVGVLPSGVRAHRGLSPQASELVDLYRSADVFVLPSRGDCLAQAIVEAQACAIPVVSTSVGALGEVVRDLENGLIVAPGSPHAITNAIRTLAAHPDLRVELGLRGREQALREHDAMVNNRRIFKLLGDIAAVGVAS